VNGTIERRLLERFAMRRVGRQWNMNFGRQSNNSARRIFRHFFFHFNGHPFQAEPQLVRFHSHDRAHARAERSGDEISRRKRFAFAFVVRGRVGRNFRLRWPMRCIAMQIASVFDVDFDHPEVCGAFSSLSCRAKSRHPVKLPFGCATGFLDFARNDRQ
jgi:hypothetical protein